MKRWLKRIGIIVLTGSVVGAGFFVFSIWYTNRSDFCTTCHYMQPFYDAWASSTHNTVPCRDCHYEPGYSSVVKGKLRDLNQLAKYWTKAYQRSRPWAEVSDASCLRSGCHETRLLQGRVMFEKVNFDHRPHLEQMRRGKKLRCTSCHSQIVQGEHMTVTETTCILCHFKIDEAGNNIAGCAICHDPPVARADQEEPPKYDHTRVLAQQIECVKCHGTMVVGDGAVPRERCYACHWERERLEQFHNTDLMHAKHITESKIECDRCHLSMQHKSVQKERAMPECETCHSDFHTMQKDLFVGHGGIGLADRPNPMFKKGLSCQGCHVLHGGAGDLHLNGNTFTASGESCEPCHGTGYNRLLQNWNKAINEKTRIIGKALADAEQIRKRSSSVQGKTETADSLFHAAQFNYEIVHLGKPIHNIVYANELLEAAHDQLDGFFSALAPDYRLPSLGRSDKLVPAGCVNCHIGIEDINVRIYGLDYSHKRHLINAGLDCTRCHSNQQRHGELVVQREDCLSCHHSRAESECGNCHTVQKEIIRGESPSLPLGDADIMFASDVGCRDCHELPDGNIARPVPQRCVDCHDRDYADTQREWLAEFAALKQSVGEYLKEAEARSGVAGGGELISRVRSHIQVIEADGSQGTHNHFELMRILEEDRAALRSLLGESP